MATSTFDQEAAPVSSFVSDAIKARREHLPIFAMKNQLIEMMKKHQVLIVKGDTGSGKSTQLPQYLAEAGFGVTGKIGITQPRRVAATSLASRVAEEVGCQVGESVGYRIRFDNKTSCNTNIVFMTDGILLQEFAHEPMVYSYSAIMLDEAHERILNTDILLGLIKAIMRKRPELKVLITSATLEDDKFSRYFNNAPVFEIPGRTYNVDIVYVRNPEPDHRNACVSAVMNIHRQEAPGDILVFLPGQDDISDCEDKLANLDHKNELWVLPFLAALPTEEQTRVFNPCPQGYKRKVVLATNIAETSLTIDGIVYVVDTGYVKQSEFDAGKRVKTLKQVEITQAQAVQRKGRAGRTCEGKCYRLYSEYTFNCMKRSSVPEIQRCNLEHTILLLAAHGVEDINGFDFIDRPPSNAISASLVELQDLGALDSLGRLTKFGREISRFPVDPKLAKVLIMSKQLGCSEDILTIVSALTAQSTAGKIFIRNKNKFLSDRSKASFLKTQQGDHLTLLEVCNQWKRNGYSSDWCRRFYINDQTLEEALPVRDQLQSVLENNAATTLPPVNDYVPSTQSVQRCILSGYFSQIARKTRGYGYVTYANPNRDELVYIHPTSALFKTTPEWVIYEELMWNAGKKPYMLNVIKVEPDWVRLYAPAFYPKMLGKLGAIKYQGRQSNLDLLDSMYQDLY